MNMWAIQTAVNSLLSSVGAYISVTGATQISPTQFNLDLSNGGTIGPITLPLSYWNWRGTWTATTVYAVNDVFAMNGVVYLVLIGTTSSTTFDPGATDGAGHNLFAPMLSLPSNILPTGGTIGQLLAKNSSTDFDMQWINPPVSLPTGGTTGQALVKTSNTNYAVTWTTIPIMSVGGTTGQLLAKNSGSDFDTHWVTVGSVPVGGFTGQFLMKNSNTDYDYYWANAFSPLISTLVPNDFILYDGTNWVNAPFQMLQYKTSTGARGLTTTDAQTFIASLDTSGITTYTIFPTATTAFTVGAEIAICQSGVGGSIQIMAGAGVILQVKEGYGSNVTKLNGIATLKYVGDTGGNSYWIVGGDLDAAGGIIGRGISGTSGVVTLDSSAFGEVLYFTPTGDLTINASVVRFKSVKLIITTGDTTSHTITFGTNFVTTGPLTTGVVSGKTFVVTFVSNGATFYEQSRTVAM
jgi:hypothetical protein